MSIPLWYAPSTRRTGMPLIEGSDRQKPVVGASHVVKRSIVIRGHKTSVSLEQQFWDELCSIARHRGETIGGLVGDIDASRRHGNLSSAIRLFVLDTCRSEAENAGLKATEADAHLAVAAGKPAARFP